VTILAILGWVLAALVGAVAWRFREEALRAETERRALAERTRSALLEAEASLRRVRDESDRARPFAAEPILRELVEVVDDLDRALAAGEGGIGVAMIQRRSLALLRRHGAERIESLEQPLDPTCHEAVATRPVEGPPGRVVAELAAGYRLHGRLLRAARVVVAVEPVTEPVVAPVAEPVAEPVTEPVTEPAGAAAEPTRPPDET
jgi:molecular chaperone GrpE